jgi:galactokinase/mevalonate kinase-like predicted kinase
MRGALGASDWGKVARLLREEWSFRKRNAPGITTPLIDELVKVTRGRRGRWGRRCAGRGAAGVCSWWSGGEGTGGCLD